MPPEPARYRALGHAVRARRNQLGIALDHTSQHGGPSRNTVGDVERGERTSYADRTWVLMDQMLRWKPGQGCEAILAGRDPEPAGGDVRDMFVRDWAALVLTMPPEQALAEVARVLSGEYAGAEDGTGREPEQPGRGAAPAVWRSA